MAKPTCRTTHFVCDEQIRKYGGKTKGCCCIGHSCKVLSSETSTIELRQLFFKKLDTLDKKQRQEVVLKMDGQPYTWNPIWLEVYNYTDLGNKMLRKLHEEGLLK